MSHYSGGPYSSPPPGPGAAPGQGWGGGWGPPPEAPKPGVVPLRPLAVGDILSGTFAAFGRHWKQLMGIAALVYCLALVVTGGAVALAVDSLTDEFDVIEQSIRAGDPEPPWEAFRTIGYTFGVVALVGLVCLLLATAMTQAASPAALQEAVLGRRTTFGAIWNRAVRRLPAVLGVLLVPWLAVFVVLGLLVTGYAALMFGLVESGGSDLALTLTGVGLLGALLLGPLAIWLWVLFSLAPAVAVFETAGPMRALHRSAQLVKGAWWRIFGITLLVWGMATVASWFIQVPFTFLGMFSMLPGMNFDPGSNAEAEALQFLVSLGGYLLITMLGGFVSQIVVTFFPQLSTGLLYVDQRIRRENLAPVLAEAAHLPPPPQQYPQAPQH
ncbi:hypothetical protein ACFYVL_37700 [Streptomyces sp. NPDC004111]|uniref:hypothetical protein n=1 Tax=Streptomyces sp. NPDC004111 TaxID=3364690 RepID=UPI0036956AF1